MIYGTKATNCYCDCSATLFQGTNCEIEVPCNSIDITCKNNGIITGTKFAKNCECDC